jgi:hypothetical protein
MDKATASNMHDALTAISVINDTDVLTRIYDEVRARIRREKEAAANNIGWRVRMKVRLKSEYILLLIEKSRLFQSESALCPINSVYEGL